MNLLSQYGLSPENIYDETNDCGTPNNENNWYQNSPCNYLTNDSPDCNQSSSGIYPEQNQSISHQENNNNNCSYSNNNVNINFTNACDAEIDWSYLL